MLMIQFEEFNDSIASEFGYTSFEESFELVQDGLIFMISAFTLLYIIIIILVIILLIVLIRKLTK